MEELQQGFYYNTYKENTAVKSFSPHRSFEKFKGALLDLKLRAFKTKIPFELPFKNYKIKTAQSYKELKEVLHLRKSIFGLNDFDRYDLLGDHILLINEEGSIVGTYRLLTSCFTREFYSQNEFEIEGLLEKPGVKLELGRAVLHPEHRKGSALHLIWRGLAEYIKRTEADYLFGCSSVFTEDLLLAQSIYSHFHKEGQHSDEYQISPNREWIFPNTPDMDFGKNEQEVMTQIPTLLKSYIKAGAKVHGEPRVDEEFGCVDYFTILKTSEMTERHYKKYFGERI